jgi:hypothetical protein
MRVLYADGPVCDLPTLKRLLLVADEIGFANRPAVVFDQKWGLVGAVSPVRPYSEDDSPVSISVHAPPSGPLKVYGGSMLQDFTNPEFVRTFLGGLADDVFAGRHLALAASYGEPGTGDDIRKALLADQQALLAADLGRPLEEMSPEFRHISDGLFRVDTTEERVNALRHLMADASAQISGSLIVAERMGLAPVSDDRYTARLLGIRTGGKSFIGAGGPKAGGALGLTMIRAVIPDENLQRVSPEELLKFRRKARDPYNAWSAEMDRLAIRASEVAPEKIEEEIEKMVYTEMRPKLIQYEAEIKGSWTSMFEKLVTQTTLVPTATVAVAHLFHAPLAVALPAALISAAATFPISVTETRKQRRETKAKNPFAYLIGVRNLPLAGDPLSTGMP